MTTSLMFRVFSDFKWERKTIMLRPTKKTRNLYGHHRWMKHSLMLFIPNNCKEEESMDNSQQKHMN